MLESSSRQISGMDPVSPVAARGGRRTPTLSSSHRPKSRSRVGDARSLLSDDADAVMKELPRQLFQADSFLSEECYAMLMLDDPGAYSQCEPTDDHDMEHEPAAPVISSRERALAALAIADRTNMVPLAMLSTDSRLVWVEGAEQVLPTKGLILLVGKPGSGKSTIAVILAQWVTVGGDCWGKPVKGPLGNNSFVLFFDWENRREALGLTTGLVETLINGESSNLCILYCKPKYQLTPDLQEVLAKIREVEETGGEVKMVILDSLSMGFCPTRPLTPAAIAAFKAAGRDAKKPRTPNFDEDTMPTLVSLLEESINHVNVNGELRAFIALLVHHLNKQQAAFPGGSDMNSVAGAACLTRIPELIMQVTPGPQGDSVRHVEALKNTKGITWKLPFKVKKGILLLGYGIPVVDGEYVTMTKYITLVLVL